MTCARTLALLPIASWLAACGAYGVPRPDTGRSGTGGKPLVIVIVSGGSGGGGGSGSGAGGNRPGGGGNGIDAGGDRSTTVDASPVAGTDARDAAPEVAPKREGAWPADGRTDASAIAASADTAPADDAATTPVTGTTTGGGGDGDGAGSQATDDAGALGSGADAAVVDLPRPSLEVLSVAPLEGTAAVSVLASIAITFDAAVDPATLIAQVAPGPCAGSVQASTDDFVTCLGFASSSGELSAGGAVATFVPAPAFSYGTVVKTRITTAVASTDGATLAAPVLGAGFTTALPGPSCDGSVVLSQLYGGGGNAGALFAHDFVELHNRGERPVELAGWSIQYASAAGGSWSVTALPAAVIQGGGYFLVQEGAGSGGAAGGALPAPDATGTINLGGTSGKVALVAGTAPLSGACPSGDPVIDLVGYGTAGCFEGSAAGSPAAGTSLARLDAGCADSQQNASDLLAGAPAPRSAAAMASVCACGGAPTMNETGQALEADDCRVQSPPSLTVAAGALTPVILGRVREAGLTEADGAAAALVAEVGFGPLDVNPSTQGGWTWLAAAYDAQIADADQYQASFTAPAATGSYGYAYRFSLDAGQSWTYCDANGAGSDAGLTFETTQLPLLTVTPPVMER
jgi:hypothetical protein